MWTSETETIFLFWRRKLRLPSSYGYVHYAVGMRDHGLEGQIVRGLDRFRRVCAKLEDARCADPWIYRSTGVREHSCSCDREIRESEPSRHDLAHLREVERVNDLELF